MNTLPGLKTYLVAIAGLIYIALVKLGVWKPDAEIIAALGFAAVAFLRAGIAKLPSSTPAFALAAMLAFLVVSPATRAAETSTPAKSACADLPLYRTGEVSATAFATIATPDFKHYSEGYGVGVGYFYHVNFGVEGRITHEGFDLDRTLVSDAAVRFIARLPLGHLAPYTYLGAGYSFQGEGTHIDAGFGAEWRFTRRLGVFAEAGLLANFSGANRYAGAAGVRFTL